MSPTRIDSHRATVALPDATLVLPQDASVTLDESWSPYAQGRLTLVTPDDLDQLDPREGGRCTITLTRKFGNSLLTSMLTALFGSGTTASLTMAYGAGLTSAISAVYGHVWTAGETRRNQSRTFDLGIRQREITTAGTVELALSSDEALLQDFAPFGSPDYDGAIWYAGPVGVVATLAELCQWAVDLVSPGATFAPVVRDFDISSNYVVTVPAVGDGYPWMAGKSAWDFLTPFLELASLRLWCDETRVWHLTETVYDTPGSLAVTAGVDLVDASDQVSRDDDGWADAVVVVYRSTDAVTGVNLIGHDSAPEPLSWPVGGRTLTIEHNDTPYPGPGAAAGILERSLLRGRNVPATAISDYTANPGIPTTVTPLTGDPYVGNLRAVTWDAARAEMNLELRNVEA